MSSTPRSKSKSQNERSSCARNEEALRQAQNMEAVGQLTGGAAHDVNNLLQVIIGNLDTIQRNLPTKSGRLQRAAKYALNGAQRAANLTQRLLAFSRRQPLDPNRSTSTCSSTACPIWSIEPWRDDLGGDRAQGRTVARGSRSHRIGGRDRQSRRERPRCDVERWATYHRDQQCAHRRGVCRRSQRGRRGPVRRHRRNGYGRRHGFENDRSSRAWR